MHRLLVGIVLLCAFPSLAAGPPRPLVDSVTISQSENAVVEVHSSGLVLVPAVGNGIALSDGFCVPPDDPAKENERTRAPGVIFKNRTGEAWTVRVVPAGADGAGATCHTLQCARTLAELKVNGLCDRSPADSDQCVTSAPALGSCFGPECNAARAKCVLQGDPQNRSCTLSVQELIAACNTSWCGRVVALDAFQGTGRRYAQRTEGVTPPAPELEELPAAIFPPESVGKAPYRFYLEGESGAFRTLTVTAGGNDCPPLQRSTTTFNEVAVIPLDNTGVASWVYLNPMNPACLTCDGSEIRPLAFENRTSDRAFTVSIDLPAEVSVALTAEGCTANKPCKLARTIEPNNATIFEPEILKLVPAKTLLRFKVSFADEVEKPSNATAYIRVAREVEDPSSQLATSFVTKIGAQLDPFVAAVPEKFTDADGDGLDDTTRFEPCYPLASPADYKKENEPALCAGNRVYDGDYARHYTGLVRVDLAKPLGRQADISASVTYRTSDLGVDDGNVAKLSEYGINVYGSNAIFARFGRTTWANPSNGIAIFEKGDGYRFTFKNLSVAHVIKRESERPPADDANRDHKSFVAQVKSLPVNRWRGRPIDLYFFRGLKLLDLTAVRGEDKTSHVYRTVGGELFYTFRNPVARPGLGTLTGSAAAYRSTRHATTETVAGARHGKGWVGLFTATWIPRTQSAAAGGFEARRSYTVQFGKGTSDDPDTPDTREDYVGEGGSFSGDTLLMSTFVGKIDVKGHVIVGPSLANKRYLGLQIVDNTWSPLEDIADLFGVGADVNSRSSTLRVRNYTFGRPVFESTHSRDAVTEYSIEFAVEVPKGVRTTLGAGYMRTGRGIEPVIDNDTWVITTGVSLTL